ncbi:MAG TPA: ABC transporter ATP-binding protein [Gemmataceae bacterium]|nr:ABC transporter ATP-binding protein [Gemmataceae bacterium]
MARIELNSIGLTFRVRRHFRMGLKEFLLGQMFRRSRNPMLDVHALSGVNLRVERGDRVGVIGHNGAGKSTLLKLLAGVYQPTHGTMAVEGKVSSLFDLALGFETDASGWENIAYRSYLQGETPRTVKAKRDAIAEFTGLGDFLNTPVRYYSAGMLVRLAFSIATAIDPEILLVDEVLSVGDLAFQEKARQRMHDMMDRAHLMVMVSHDLEALAKICNRAIWMDHGRMIQEGPIEQIVAAYRASAMTVKAA